MAVKSGSPQNVQGPRPSLTQITLLQLRQLGAAVRRGCREPMQLQARLEESRRRVLLVLISRERMAASSSVRTVEAPCMEVPPVMFTLVGLDVEEDGGAGEDVRVVGVLFVLKSDIKVPDAEGGPL